MPQTLVYTVAQGGAVLADLAAAVSRVPLPQDILDKFGIAVLSDVTAPGPPVTRTVVVDVAPTSATAVATLDPETLGIKSVQVTSGGSGWIRSPSVIVTDAGLPSVKALLNSKRRGASLVAYLNVNNTTLVGGTGYSPTTTIGFIGGFALGGARLRRDPALLGARPGADVVGVSTRTKDAPAFDQEFGEIDTREFEGLTMTVGAVTMVQKGRRYSASTFVEFVGGLEVGAVPATGVPLFDPKGRVVAVMLTSGGHGYITAPTINVIDPTGAGSGAKAVPSMQRGDPANASLTIDPITGTITAINLAGQGLRYVSVPTIVIFDPTGAGSGASATAIMGVERIDVLASGKGYLAPPNIGIVPFYEMQFLFGSIVDANPAPLLSSLSNFMTSRIQRVVATPVIASPPV
jgi:hypothetical protein